MSQHNITVLVETMPAHLRDSHRTCRNWGEYPGNGAVRTRRNLAEAAEIAAADDEYDHLVAGSEIMIFEMPTPVENQVAALLSYSIEHDIVSTPRSPALADALEKLCEGWCDDGSIWGGDENGFWMMRLLEPTRSLEEWEVTIAGKFYPEPPPEEPVPETLRDLTVGQRVETEESTGVLVGGLIADSIRTGMVLTTDYAAELELALRELANEWTVSELGVITFEGLAEGQTWRIALKGDPF
ncbi:MAG: hypothetical protein A2Y74_05295 [Actinobacteria bacterium RBG_13_63_9]|nr:MAG: hypothetical protein A2Y74_05295 [Actinobacteria bacterium RBG_13_63_9]